MHQPRAAEKQKVNRGGASFYKQATPTGFDFRIRFTATPEAPWYVVPADNKWFTRVVAARAALVK